MVIEIALGIALFCVGAVVLCLVVAFLIAWGRTIVMSLVIVAIGVGAIHVGRDVLRSIEGRDANGDLITGWRTKAIVVPLDTQEPLWKKDPKVHIHKIVPGVRIEWAYGNGEPTGTCHFFGEDGDRPCGPSQTVAPALPVPFQVAPPPSVYRQ